MKMAGQIKEGFLDRLKYLFTSPSTFFDKIGSEGILNALLTYTATFLVIHALSAFRSFFRPHAIHYNPLNAPMFTSMFGYHGYETLTPFLWVLIQLVLSLAIIFIYAGLIFLMVKLSKGQGSYADTFKIIAYSLVPSNIISIIPFIGLLSIFYSIVLMMFGVKELHQLSSVKAVTSVLLPSFVILMLLVLLFSAEFFLFYAPFFVT